MLAGFGQALDHFLGDFGLERAAGQVIHEEQRRRALHRNVVDAVIDQVGADGVVDVHLEGDFQLGAHAVHARDQDGVHPLRLVHGKQAAEAADFAQDAAGKRLVGEILDPLFGSVGAVNIHTSIGVGDSGLRGIMGHGSQRVSVIWGICQASHTGQAAIVARWQVSKSERRAKRESRNGARGSTFREMKPGGLSGTELTPELRWRNHPPPSRPRSRARPMLSIV